MSKKLNELLANPLEGLVEAQLNRMFVQWNSGKGIRAGIHTSSIIEPEDKFCYREQILALFCKKNQVELPVKLLRIFLHGWSVHEKWQSLFQESGVAESIERSSLSKKWDLYLTPDAIIRLGKKRYVVEIKSMNTYQFKKLKGPPSNAVRQAQVYMHQVSIPNAIILVEDKNDQAFKVFLIDYEPEIVRPYIERLHNISRLAKAFEEQRKLPKRICMGLKDKRAVSCQSSKACFCGKNQRENMILCG
jgi:hypothetical protein